MEETDVKPAGAGKIGPLMRKLNSRGFDALMVTHPPNLRYLFGFTGSTGAALVTSAGSYLFLDSRYTLQGRRETVGCSVEPALPSAEEALARKAASLGTAILGIEPSHVTLEQFRTLRNLLPRKIAIRHADPWIEDFRIVKTIEEIEEIERTLSLTTRAFDATIPLVKPGVREVELAAELEYQLLKCGARKVSFDIIIASGSRSAMPHALPSDKKLERSDFVVCDFGAYRKGYASDVTRTVFLGKPSSEAKRVYETVLSAVENVEEVLHAGLSARSVDRLARSTIEKSGLGEYFVHGTGHGIGLEVHEAPHIHERETRRVRENMVFTVEPGVYLPGKSGVRIEDVVAVEKSGCRVLTQYTKELIAL